MSISVALATFNEEKNLHDCLASVKDLADEIVVVDGSSTDKTVEIAKQFGAKVLITNNPPIFHLNKQKAIDACTGDWILQLDADERVSPELAKEILSTIEQSNNLTINGFWLPRRNWFLGRFFKKGGQYPDYTLRLYRRGKAYMPCKSVHEQAMVEGEVGYLKNDLIHLADPDFKRYFLRWHRYTALVAEEIKVKSVKKSIPGKIYLAFDYLLIQPWRWFLLIYVRHKGFVDSWQGFVFAFFSGFKFPVAYFMYLTSVFCHPRTCLSCKEPEDPGSSGFPLSRE